VQPPLFLVVVLALVFAWTNGVHDAANAVATSITTRTLTLGRALALAAVLNVVGALFGEGIAHTVGSEIVSPTRDHLGLGAVLAALLAATAWNLVTWWRGMPSSSSHALLGALAGAALAAGVQVDQSVVANKVVLPLLASPVVGFLLAWLLLRLLLAVFAHATHANGLRGFRVAQTVSASAMALGHGLQDGQKTMGVVVLALVAAGDDPGSGLPLWVKVTVALMLGLGTWAGGRPLMRTLGRRVVQVDPVTGFSAETTAAALLYLTSYVFTVPVSSTHTITASIAGAGSAARGRRAPRLRVLRRIVVVWLVTLPGTALLAAGCYGAGVLLSRLG